MYDKSSVWFTMISNPDHNQTGECKTLFTASIRCLNEFMRSQYYNNNQELYCVTVENRMQYCQ